MDAIVKLVQSRRKSIAVLVAEVEEYEKQRDAAGLTSPAGIALGEVVKVKKARLEKLRQELAGFESVLPNAGQASVPGTEAPSVAPRRR